jgi:hypothetical protein
MMIKAYINYPNPHVTVHTNMDCGNIQAQKKDEQRYLRINPLSISDELKNFSDRKYRFAAYPERNDLWLEIEFQDQAFEMAVLELICRILGKQYQRLADLEPQIHC